MITLLAIDWLSGIVILFVAVYLAVARWWPHFPQRAKDPTLTKPGPLPQLTPDFNSSIRAAMDQAWRDHHHARDQTWNALRIEAVLAGGMVTTNFVFTDPMATMPAAAIVVLACLFGMLISIHHRRLEVRKITHVYNCEQVLGLHHPDLISDVRPPKMFSPFDVVFPWENNTALFIFRMHVALLVFAVVFAHYRV